MAWDPDFIDFIDAYCDRWCERCPLTHKCAAFSAASDPDEIDDCSEQVERAMEALRTELRMPAPAAKPWLDELDEIPEPTEQETREYARVAAAREDRRRNHPLMVSALEYSIDAYTWLRMYEEPTRASVAAAGAALGDSPEAVAVKLEIQAVLDALEVVHWDSALVAAKLHRALGGKEAVAEDDGFDGDPIQTDFNGSAKLTLILTERSEAGWRLIAQWAPESDVAIQMADTLAALRAGVERTFPNARHFRRPGFDAPA